MTVLTIADLDRLRAMAHRAFALALCPGIRWPPVPLQLAGIAEVTRLRALRGAKP